MVARATRSAPFDPPRYLMQEHLTGHVKAGDGERLARVNVEIHQAQNDAIEGRSTSRGIAAGGLFRLRDHPGGAQNRQYLVIENRAEIVSDAYVSTSDSTLPIFDCSFRAIRGDNTFRSPRTTPVPRVAGPQTAVVIGPPGDEILTDQYGRVKVQFHWEQLAQPDGANRLDRCWVRVAQSWANRRWGTMFLPRVGQEVLVEFIEGDPDRPVITGAVYNSTNMPPYELPAERGGIDAEEPVHQGRQRLQRSALRRPQGRRAIVLPRRARSRDLGQARRADERHPASGTCASTATNSARRAARATTRCAAAASPACSAACRPRP